MPEIQQKITPFLWFDCEAEEAAKFYTSIFENSRITRISRYGKVGREVHGKEAGSVLTVEFEIEGQTFIALNGGPQFKFNEAVSFQVTCETQDEIDYFWSKLSEGGQEGQCGWLKDKYGLSWQVVPSALPRTLSDADSAKSERVMKALLQMKKFDLQTLEWAYTGLAAATTEAVSVGDVASLTRQE
jgi:predicted 3-demethylubiquinone-9 3-methyltransferase (glyoxalase superfamily)